MESVIFVGLPAAGKSLFYKERFFRTHVRINLDMLRTRRREALLLAACFEMQQPFVIDNTNPSAADRRRYLIPARERGVPAHCYYFSASGADCLKRNRLRNGKERVTDQAIRAIERKLEIPSYDEGFEVIYRVNLDEEGRFSVERMEGGAD